MSAPAAAERLPLRSYGTADGLPSTAIIDILRDTRGFLWFSTRDGLARFDGSRFVLYGKEHGLPVPTVNFTLESRRGGYWIATNGGGVCRLDAEASLPVRPGGAPLFRCLPVGPHEVSNRVDRLLEDRAGRLWAATDGGLFALDPTGSRFDAVDLGVSAPEGSLNTLVEDHDGSLWIGGALALFRRLPGGRIVRLPSSRTRSSSATSSTWRARRFRRTVTARGCPPAVSHFRFPTPEATLADARSRPGRAWPSPRRSQRRRL